MFVVAVTFQIKPDRLAEFMPMMQRNAAQSLSGEADCHRFDVCQRGTEILLYELYSDAAAFEFHKQQEHFLSFDRETADMVAAKTVETYQLLDQ